MNTGKQDNAMKRMQIDEPKTLLPRSHILKAMLLSTVAMLQTPETANAELPSVRARHGSPITPSAAWQYFGNGTINTSTTYAWTQRPDEIKALARSLGAGRLSASEYADAVNRYIQSNVNVEMRFGLSKGGLGAVVDQSGTPFDQAHLMIELLREGNVAASYNVGIATMTADQFGRWSGLVKPTSADSTNLISSFTVDARAACEVLADGGIPATIGSPSGCASVSGNLSAVSFGHVWVSANGRQYDPSYKIHDLWQQDNALITTTCGGADCGSTLTAAVQSGASLSSNYLENPNFNALVASMKTQAQAAEHRIRTLSSTQVSHITREQFTGGRKIRPNVEGYTSLPYSAVAQYTWTGDIPDQFRTKATVAVPGAFTKMVYLDEIAGRRLALVTGAELEASYPNNSDGTKPVAGFTLLLEQLRLAQGTVPRNVNAPELPIQIALDHPYPNIELGSGAPNGSYQDDFESLSSRLNIYVKKGNQGGTQAYSLILQAGKASPASVAFTTDLIKAPLRISPPAGAEKWGPADKGIPACGTTNPFRAQSAYGSRFASEFSQATALASDINFIRSEIHHSIGYFADTSAFTPPSDPNIPNAYAGQLKSTNIVSGISMSSAYFDKTAERGASGAIGALFASIEGSAIEQMEALWTSGTAGDSLKLRAQSGGRFYIANATTWNSVESQLTGYSSDLKNFVGQYIANGYTILIPQNASLTGTINGYNFSDPRSGFFAWKAGMTRIAAIDFLLGKGAGSSQNLDPVKLVDQAIKAPTSKRVALFTPDLDATTGRVNISFPADITAGSGEFPHSLSIKRSYSSDSHGPEACIRKDIGGGMLGITNYWIYAEPSTDSMYSAPGWRTNWNWEAEITSDIDRAFGSLSALDAAPRISAVLGLSHLARSTAPSIGSQLALALGAEALSDQLELNAVRVSQGDSSSLFLKAADGISYLAEPWSSEQLIKTGPEPLKDAWLDLNFYDFGGIGFQHIGSDGATTTYQQFGGKTPTKGGIAFGGFGGTSPDAPSGATFIGSNVEANRFKATSWQKAGDPKVTFTLTATVPPSATDLSSGNTNWQQGGTITEIKNSLGRTLSKPIYPFPPEIQDEIDQNGIGQYWLTDDGKFAGYQSGLLTGYLGLAPPTNVPYPTVSLDKVLTARKVRQEFTYDAYDPSTSHMFGLETIRTETNTGLPDLKIKYNDLGRVEYSEDALGRRSELYAASLFGEATKFGDLVDPLGNKSEIVGNQFGKIIQSSDPLNRVTKSSFTNTGQQLSSTNPEGVTVTSKYDLRGNKIEERIIAKPGSGLADLVTQWAYLEAPTVTECVTQLTCNKPAYIIDPNGNRVDMTWSSVHGGILTKKSGLTSNGTCGITANECPETTYTYSSFTGVDGTTFYLPASIVEKIDASRSVTTRFEYDTSNKYVLRSKIVDGNGQSLRTCYQFDAGGNPVSVTEPNAGLTACPSGSATPTPTPTPTPPPIDECPPGGLPCQ
ncbi:hypothetical protein [Parasphingorhabdus sp.]|uniref:hypothetical protein n=1 Tax=Parasphingorhabdus sp. TaxID=2709688 RepID=UPI0032661D90